MGNGSEDTFSNGDTQAANKHSFWEKNCSTDLFTKKMQIKTTMRYHFTPWIAKIKDSQ